MAYLFRAPHRDPPALHARSREDLGWLFFVCGQRRFTLKVLGMAAAPL
jgi:hypothetical protein